MAVTAVIVLSEYNYWPALPKKIYTNPFQLRAIEPRRLTNYWPSLRPFIANLRISTHKTSKKILSVFIVVSQHLTTSVENFYEK